MAEISFNDVRSKEIINIYDGKRLGRVIDFVFEKESGKVLGFVIPGIKKAFRKTDDIFIPLGNIKKIGDDVILVKLCPMEEENQVRVSLKEQQENKIYARYKRVVMKE